jgi:aryl-alcohol dehydrogenase-like predicted oxidoreductase
VEADTPRSAAAARKLRRRATAAKAARSSREGAGLRGLLSGHWSAERGTPQDFRATSPRFQGENLHHNPALVKALRGVASGRGATVAQVAIAWVAAQGADIVPLVGARRRDRLAEALGAQDLRLTAGDLAAIEAAVPDGAVAGTRYATAHMAMLDGGR